MPELDAPTEDERERASRRRGTRLALVIAATGGAMALLAGVALAVSTTARVVEMQPAATHTAEGDAVTAPVTTPSPLPTTATAPVTTPLDAGEPEAPVEDPVYDASTDIATIPRPATESYEGELANAEIWLTQQGIIADCMLEQGFDFTFTPFWLRTSTTPFGLEPQMSEAESLALWGLNRGSGDDYDWRDAGCHGYAVHVTGMDDAN
jgi:hypothetical protein